MGGQATHIPLRVNAAGMIPIIFAVTLMQFPSNGFRAFAKSISLMGMDWRTRSSFQRN